VESYRRIRNTLRFLLANIADFDVQRDAMLVEQSGIEAWFSLNSAELLGDDAAHYRKLSDTLDVWFDSGATHYAVLAKREGLRSPADLYLEGSDQHRGWFQSSLLTGCAINGRAPYDALLTHGFVVDGHGHKMSKSKGNVIVPQKVIDTLGADILRLWTASTDYSGELTISDEILKRVVESYRRIRNTLRFLLANIADFDVQRDAMLVEQWLEIDRYALALTQKLQDGMCGDYERYEFHFAVQKLVGFCSEDLGGFYLDILKDRLYTAGENSKARRSAQNALYHITQSLARLIAPILSFTGEEVWATLQGRDDVSVFEQLWYKLPDAGLKGEAVSAWGDIRAVRELVNKKLEEQRATGAIGSALQAEVDVYAPKATFELLARLGDDLRLVFITSRAKVHQREGEMEIKVTPSAQQKCERCWHYREDVGSDANHPTLCGRCVSNLFGTGESRQYA
jgi:isoleucyl-tRNA synthetase